MRESLKNILTDKKIFIFRNSKKIKKKYGKKNTNNNLR